MAYKLLLPPLWSHVVVSVCACGLVHKDTQTNVARSQGVFIRSRDLCQIEEACVCCSVLSVVRHCVGCSRP